MGYFRDNYIRFQFAALLAIAGMLGLGVFGIHRSAALEREVLNLVTASQAHRAAVQEETQKRTETLLRGTGVTPTDAPDVATLVAKDLGEQMAKDPQGPVKKSIDAFKQAVDSRAPAADRDEKARAVRGAYEAAIRRAAGVLGLSAGVTESVVEKMISWSEKAAETAGEVVFEEIIKDAYRFTRDAILGTHESSVVCKCCSKEQSQPPSGGGGVQPLPPPGQPQGGALHGESDAQRLVVHFSSQQWKISNEVQVEQLWRARALWLSAARTSASSAGLHLHLHAYTDTTGSEGLNLRLRKQRAQSVETALEKVFSSAGAGFSPVEIDSTESHALPVPVTGKVAIPSNRVVTIDLGS